MEDYPYCRFCFPPDEYRIISTTENFYVMLSLGPIVEGYSLIVSKSHFPCVANIPSETRLEFATVYDNLRDMLVKTYGNVISYEHGQAGSCLALDEASKSHCHHAHMHLVPASVSINKLVALKYEAVKLDSINDLWQQYESRPAPYLYVHDDATVNIYYVPEKIETQYLRKVVASELGLGDAWDWITHPDLATISLGVNRLKTQFEHDN